jgi:hypothetical protein
VTCVGYNICGPTLAIAYSDTELYCYAVPTRHRSKLALNALAVTVGAGTGLIAFLREGEEVVADATSFDAAVVELPGRLSQASRALAEHRLAARSSSCAYFLVGFSHRRGRIVGAVFDAQRDFAPVITPSFSAPAVELDVVDEQSAIAACQQQMLLVQKRNPGAGNGVITMARITPTAISTGPVFDLGTGVMLRRPFKFCAEGLDARPGDQPSAFSLVGQ